MHIVCTIGILRFDFGLMHSAWNEKSYFIINKNKNFFISVQNLTRYFILFYIIVLNCIM